MSSAGFAAVLWLCGSMMPAHLHSSLVGLQTQTVSDRDAHDQEVEGLERKLTEAEREAAAANVGFPLLLAAWCPGVTFTVQHGASVLPSNAC